MKKNLSSKAIRLLRKVEKHILEEPLRFIMCGFVETSRDFHRMESSGPFPKCGTAACIAGWSVLLSGEKPIHPWNQARSLLGIDEDQAGRLFIDTGWPEPFRSRFKEEGTKRDAQAAVGRIEHFIKTDGAE